MISPRDTHCSNQKKKIPRSTIQNSISQILNYCIIEEKKKFACLANHSVQWSRTNI